eukprot:826719-Karenia_brevis.AAC.1
MFENSNARITDDYTVCQILWSTALQKEVAAQAKAVEKMLKDQAMEVALHRNCPRGRRFDADTLGSGISWYTGWRGSKPRAIACSDGQCDVLVDTS